MLVTVSTHDDTRKLLVLAVDDELHGLDQLRHCLESNARIGRVIPAVDASEALRLLGSEDEEIRMRKERGLPPVDAVFADINMPGLSGMEMSRVFASLNPAPVLVFVTGHATEAVDAFDLGAVDYVLKPARQDRIDKAVARVIEKMQSMPVREPASTGEPVKTDDEVIPVELAGTTKLIPRSSVRWVEAQGDYARLFTTEGSHLVRIPLAQLEERWGKAGFVRIHRSFLVALPLITELRMGQGGYQVVIGNDEKVLPVSRRHTRELKDRLVGSSRTG
ncbi:DNA-binding response regulator [Prauserella marina]|uniref:DNA-binding response regulator, LytR/AlgR family n=1 Tax=Prauserella marina TaxID=530584 RepID=A0A222VY54_9PSEU|nr:LytTR family DNA-binding domain-containing protein [Prauserella marina]ASR38834.1 DNA-binding response regulator [Prauserella marina]PWV82285.1 LytTR family two component transcriptional regulator [Prauserella marina]SDC65274.1 DNA-binding response regulator, LytR/AlgR family [Prauserella marina]